MKGFGLAVQQASPRAGKQSSVPVRYRTKPHATLQERRGPWQKIQSLIPASDWITDVWLVDVVLVLTIYQPGHFYYPGNK